MSHLQDSIIMNYIRIQNAVLGFLAKISLKNEGNIKKIIVLRIGALGDFLLAIPAMHELRKTYPEAQITLITAPTTSLVHVEKLESYLLKDDPYPWVSLVCPSIIDNTIPITSFKIAHLFFNIRKLVLIFSPDIAVILLNSGDSGLGIFKKIVFLRLIGVKNRIYGSQVRSNRNLPMEPQHRLGLLEHSIFAPLRSISELTKAKDVKSIDVNFNLDIDLNSHLKAAMLWSKHEWNSSTVIAIAPGSIQPHKRWPLKNFAELCKKLILYTNCSFIIVGTNTDKELGQELLRMVKGNLVNIAGDTTIPESAAILSRCNLIIGNDGGAMHLGSAVGKRVVSIIPGIEYPDSIEPWFSKDLAVRHDVKCAPCYRLDSCPMIHNNCMKNLTVESVYISCIAALNS